MWKRKGLGEDPIETFQNEGKNYQAGSPRYFQIGKFSNKKKGPAPNADP